MALGSLALFGLGNQGKSANVDAQSRTNLYVEVQTDPEKNVLTLYPTPGLVSFVNFGVNPIRGIYERGEIIYVVNGATLYSVNNSGTITTLGTLLTTGGRVAMADNGTQLMIVDGTYGYIYNFNTFVFARITDAAFVPCDTVAFFTGRFIVNKIGTGQFYISSIYDGLTWNALNYATAESDPDNLVRVFSDGGNLILFGDKTIELWGDTGAADFPYGRVGSTAIEWGLAAKWSLAKFMDSLIFLRKNRLGQVQVCVQSGFSAQPVSNPEIDYLLSQYTVVNDATGFSYMLSGHPMYQINFPTANVSWLYDGHSKSWSKVQYGYSGRHKAEMQVQLLGKNYVSDYATGSLYQFSQTAYTDNGQPIVREFVSRHKEDLDRSTISQMWIEMEGGVGLQTGQGTTPKLMMQISRDGGHEWGNEIWRDIGAAGNYKARALFNRVGQARDWLFKFRVTDPVKTVFIGAWGR